MMVFSRRAEALGAGKFFSQAGGLMEEHRQALRANVKFVALIFNGQQRLFLFGCAAGLSISILLRNKTCGTFCIGEQDNKGARYIRAPDFSVIAWYFTLI